MLSKKLNIPFKLQTKTLKDYFLEILNYAIGFAIFGFGVYTLSVNSFWVSYIGELTQGLTEVGYVESVDGKSTRRTYHDTIWLNLTKDKKVYTNDTIATHDSTTLEIQLQNVKITLEENSLVRIRNINGKPVIRVAKGRVNAEVGEGSNLMVQTSMKKTELQRGRYLLTSDNPPEPEGKEAEGDIANGLRSAKVVAKIDGEAKEESVDDSVPHEKVMAPPKQEVENPQWKLPTPAEGMIYLVQRPGSILFGYKEFCDDACTLIISKDNQTVKEFKFKTYEQAVAEVDSRDLPFGQYTWEYISTKASYKSHFEILPYSQENLFKNLNSKRSFEILN